MIHYTSDVTSVYKLPILSFPDHITNCYLVVDEALTLIDCGSGFVDGALEKALAALRDSLGEKIQVADVGRVIVTHGHIDHYGAVGFVREESGARVGVHELDKTSLTRSGSFLSEELIPAPDLPNQLFNLRTDPGETINVYYVPENKAVIERLTARIQAWQQETSDTLVLPVG
jgi:glyoxylase-like metal-dependent hydrolase (beta-lactamase superfamily II)